ncbi:MAG: hypothetical protein AABX00_05110 [Nanoarchaeota archaeon]
MCAFAISDISTKEFDTWERLLPKNLQKEIEEFIKELKKGSKIGQPLGYPFFLEKRIDGRRVYFLVYDDIDTVLLITISDKKAQQDTIDRIKKDLDYYKDIIRKRL